MTERREGFSSRWLMMLAMLGMAVGTGNIWRFPRIAAQNGGGEFLVAWVAFLLLWSIPLILVEFGMGRWTGSGPAKAFLKILGPRFAWMGAFIAFVAIAIMCYYSVVAGWTLRYVWAALAGQLPGAEPGAFWNGYTTSWWPVLTHAMAMGLGVLVVARGVSAIESVARILMPALLVLVVVLAVRAVTLPGAEDGLTYLFSVDWHHLTDATIWLNALTQNAWDTGAGWGLVLVYAAYLRQNEDTALNAVILPTANNVVSLLAGIMVICTAFSVLGAQMPRENVLAIMADSGPASTGLTFIWMPQLFAQLPFGRVFMILFFTALAFAAFTSLIAMIELFTRVLVDLGASRRRAVQITGAFGFLAGLPSALSLQFLGNQDWVWGVALMVSGLFFAIAVIRAGVGKFRKEQLNHAASDIHIGRWWEVVIRILVPLQAVVLLVWWLWQARGWDPTGWLNPLAASSVGTVLAQWAVVLVALILLNRWMVRRMESAG